jgi:hypothetical protein
VWLDYKKVPTDLFTPLPPTPPPCPPPLHLLLSKLPQIITSAAPASTVTATRRATRSTEYDVCSSEAVDDDILANLHQQNNIPGHER